MHCFDSNSSYYKFTGNRSETSRVTVSDVSQCGLSFRLPYGAARSFIPRGSRSLINHRRRLPDADYNQPRRPIYAEFWPFFLRYFRARILTRYWAAVRHRWSVMKYSHAFGVLE